LFVDDEVHSPVDEEWEISGSCMRSLFFAEDGSAKKLQALELMLLGILQRHRFRILVQKYVEIRLGM
jgi:hypothetical protein